jgi:hypothetical protein
VNRSLDVQRARSRTDEASVFIEFVGEETGVPPSGEIANSLELNVPISCADDVTTSPSSGVHDSTRSEPGISLTFLGVAPALSCT